MKLWSFFIFLYIFLFSQSTFNKESAQNNNTEDNHLVTEIVSKSFNELSHNKAKKIQQFFNDKILLNTYNEKKYNYTDQNKRDRILNFDNNIKSVTKKDLGSNFKKSPLLDESFFKNIPKYQRDYTWNESITNIVSDVTHFAQYSIKNLIIQPIFSGYEFFSYHAKSLTNNYMHYSDHGSLMKSAQYNRWNFKEILLAVVMRFCLGWMQNKLYYYNEMNEIYENVTFKKTNNELIKTYLHSNITITLEDNNEIRVSSGIDNNLISEFVNNKLSLINKDLHSKKNWYKGYSSSLYTWIFKGTLNAVKQPFIWTFNLVTTFFKQDFFINLLHKINELLNGQNKKNTKLDSNNKILSPSTFLNKENLKIFLNHKDFSLKILTIEYAKMILLNKLQTINKNIHAYSIINNNLDKKYLPLTTEHNDAIGIINNNSLDNNNLEKGLQKMRNDFVVKQNAKNNFEYNNNDDNETSVKTEDSKTVKNNAIYNDNDNDDQTTVKNYNSNDTDDDDQKTVKNYNNTNSDKNKDNNEQVILINELIRTIENLNNLLLIVAIMHDAKIKFDPDGTTNFTFARSLIFKITQVLMTLFDTGFVLNVVAYLIPNALPKRTVIKEKIKRNEETGKDEKVAKKVSHNFFLPQKDKWNEKKEKKFNKTGKFTDKGFIEKYWGKAALGSLSAGASKWAYEKLTGKKLEFDNTVKTLPQKSDAQFDQQDAKNIEHELTRLLNKIQEQAPENKSLATSTTNNVATLLGLLQSQISENKIEKSTGEKIITLLSNNNAAQNISASVLSEVAKKLIS